MFMYHGTSSLFLRHILEHGIKPRGESEGNWSYSGMGSRRDAVYLTNAYAVHFAEQASDGNDLLIVEVDTSRILEFLLGPDEDFMAQITHGSMEGFGVSLVERTQFFVAAEWHEYCHLWKKSVEGLGNCCVLRGVTSPMVTRYAIIPRGHSIIRMSDPSITLVNYALCGAFYRNLTKYIFGDLDFEPDVALDSTRILDIPRDGIEVVVPQVEKIYEMKA